MTGYSELNKFETRLHETLSNMILGRKLIHMNPGAITDVIISHVYLKHHSIGPMENKKTQTFQRTNATVQWKCTLRSLALLVITIGTLTLANPIHIPSSPNLFFPTNPLLKVRIPSPFPLISPQLTTLTAPMR
ncbi:MAG: hypothetical protein Q9221_006596 [Calogaya cf. arnoldii]